VKVTAKECIKSQSFTIRPLGFTDTLTVHLDSNCDCNCNEQPDPTACSGKGSVVCGICRYVLSTQNTISNAARAVELLGEGCWAKPRAAVWCTWFLQAPLCLENVGPGEGSVEGCTCGGQSRPGSAALHQFSDSERRFAFMEAGDTMSSLFHWWSVCRFPHGIHPPVHPSNYPPIHPTIEPSTNPPIEQTQISVEVSQNLTSGL